MHDFMEIFAHEANSNAGGNLLEKQVDNLFVYLFVINDVRWTNVRMIMHNLDIYGRAII